MKVQTSTNRLLGLGVIAVSLVGCTTTQPTNNNDAVRAQYEQRIKQKESEISTLQASLADAKSMSAAPAAMPAPTMDADGPLLPPNAKAGECYARVLIPPQYEMSSEQVIKTAASTRIETTPAVFGSGSEEILVKAASERLEIVPAVYGWETQEVLVKPASKKIVAVPARYENETERVLVKPEHTIWKKGTGPITKVNEITGEIMCLVTIPAEYSTISRKVLVAPATTREVEIPAEYKTVKRRVMTSPPTTRKIEIPAEYKTVKVRTVVREAASNSIEIPATYQTVSSRKLVKDGYLEWRSILCETNMTPGLITSMQSALKREGHYNGPIDGVVGSETVRGVRSYQSKHGLPSGGITMDMLKKLNVSI